MATTPLISCGSNEDDNPNNENLGLSANRTILPKNYKLSKYISINKEFFAKFEDFNTRFNENEKMNDVEKRILDKLHEKLVIVQNRLSRKMNSIYNETYNWNICRPKFIFGLLFFGIFITTSCVIYSYFKNNNYIYVIAPFIGTCELSVLWLLWRFFDSIYHTHEKQKNYLKYFNRYPLKFDDNSSKDILQEGDVSNDDKDVSDTFYDGFNWSNILVRIAFDFYDVSKNYTISKFEKAKWFIIERNFYFFLKQVNKIKFRLKINCSISSIPFEIKLKNIDDNDGETKDLDEQEYCKIKTMELNSYTHYLYPLILEWKNGPNKLEKLENILSKIKEIGGVYSSYYRTSVNNIFSFNLCEPSKDFYCQNLDYFFPRDNNNNFWFYFGNRNDEKQNINGGDYRWKIISDYLKDKNYGDDEYNFFYCYFREKMDQHLQDLSIKYGLFLIYELCLEFKETIDNIISNLKEDSSLKFDLGEIFS